MLLSIVMLSAGLSHAAAAAPEVTCGIEFSGTSTLHDWSGKSSNIHAVLRASSVPGHWDGELVVPVAGLDTDNESRDARMREMFDAARWPEIRASFVDIDPYAARTTSRLAFALTIRDVPRNLVATLSNWKQADTHISFDAAVDVSLEQFGLEAPTVLGMIRVADNVTVLAHVVVDTHGATVTGDAATGRPDGSPVANGEEGSR